LAKEADRAIRYDHGNDLPAHRAGLHRADNRQMRPLNWSPAILSGVSASELYRRAVELNPIKKT
jgi:hypothetical protein